jgi:hypothetical protein
MLEGMSVKNNREKLLEQINEHEPTSNPGKTLYTLEKYLQLFKDYLEAIQKNVMDNLGNLDTTGASGSNASAPALGRVSDGKSK